MESRMLSSAMLTTAGGLLILAGFALVVDPVLVAIVVGIPLVAKGGFMLLERRTGAAGSESPQDRSAAWRLFNASRERQTVWLTFGAALLVGGLFYFEGLTDGPLLAAVGFAILSIGAWTFDPEQVPEGA